MDNAIVPPNGRRLAPNQPGYDAEAQKELDRRVRLALSLRGKGDEERWREGREWAAVRHNKLYLQDGIGDMAEWLVRRHRLAPSTIRRRIALADNFSLAEVKKYGAKRLLDALKYVSLTAHDERERWTTGRLALEVPHPDGSVRKIAFARADESQVEAALAHQRALAVRRTLDRLPPAQKEYREALDQALTLPQGGRALATVRVRPAPSGLDDDTMLTLSVRKADLHAAIARLLRFLADPATRGGRGLSEY